MRFLTLLTALLMTSSSFATSLATVWTDTLTKVELNGKPTNYTTKMTVDFEQKEIVLDVYEDPCGEMHPPLPGVFRCMAAAVKLYTHRAPLVQTETSCGSKYYTAFEDQTRFDGFRTSIKVADHSSRICEDLWISSTIVEATIFNPRTNETTHYYMMK